MFFGKPIKSISPRELQIGIDANAICLIDVRELNEFRSGAISGAHLIPLSEFDAKKIPNYEGQTLVVYCHSGMRSSQAAKQLVNAGIDVQNLSGGIVAWRQSGFSVNMGQ